VRGTFTPIIREPSSHETQTEDTPPSA